MNAYLGILDLAGLKVKENPLKTGLDREAPFMPMVVSINYYF